MKCFYLPISEISNQICDSLFTPLNAVMKGMIGDLIQANNKVLDTEAQGFRHMSVTYTTEDIGLGVYLLPLLDKSLFGKFAEYAAFAQEWERKELYVRQFIKRVLLKATAPNFMQEQTAEKEEIDLGKIFPNYLLQQTQLNFTEGEYEENPALHKEWEEITPTINEILAFKMVA